MLDSMYQTMSIFSGSYPDLDLWNANKLQLLGLLDVRRNYSVRVTNQVYERALNLTPSQLLNLQLT